MKYHTTGISNIDDKAHGLTFLNSEGRSIGYIETEIRERAESLLTDVENFFYVANRLTDKHNLKIKISISEEG